MDNFYTRHALAYVLKQMTDDKAQVIGTVKFPNVDCMNRQFLKEAILKLKDKQKGEWILVRAYNKAEKLKQLRRQHRKKQNRLPTAKRNPFQYPTHKLADKTGSIVWKDRKGVLFYTNDLATTPSQELFDGGDMETITCVNGLANLG